MNNKAIKIEWSYFSEKTPPTNENIFCWYDWDEAVITSIQTTQSNHPGYSAICWCESDKFEDNTYRCVVSCEEPDGTPTFVLVCVVCTSDEYRDGVAKYLSKDWVKHTLCKVPRLVYTYENFCHSYLVVATDDGLTPLIFSDSVEHIFEPFNQNKLKTDTKITQNDKKFHVYQFCKKVCNNTKDGSATIVTIEPTTLYKYYYTLQDAVDNKDKHPDAEIITLYTVNEKGQKFAETDFTVDGNLIQY